VPYRGAGEAIPALLGGQVSMYFDTIMTGLPFVKDGSLRALGVSNAKRSDMAPEIPTIAEQGYPGFDIAPWYGLVASNGTPANVVTKLNGSIARLLQDPAFRERLMRTGAEARYANPTDFAAMVKLEIPRTEKLIKQSGVALQ
jgi:tripartite-type tricarboxylate transporter receptor subunit TctC